jgi:hypothetical protein
VNAGLGTAMGGACGRFSLLLIVTVDAGPDNTARGTVTGHDSRSHLLLQSSGKKSERKRGVF